MSRMSFYSILTIFVLAVTAGLYGIMKLTVSNRPRVPVVLNGCYITYDRALICPNIPEKLP